MKSFMKKLAFVLIAATFATIGESYPDSASVERPLGAAGNGLQPEQHRIYDVPQYVKDAREQCYRSEERRIEQEFAVYIPADPAVYAAWHKQGGPAVEAWAQATLSCVQENTQVGGMWNLDGLIFIGYGLMS